MLASLCQTKYFTFNTQTKYFTFLMKATRHYLVIFISQNIEQERKKAGKNISSKCLTVYFLALSFTLFTHIQTLNSPLRHILVYQHGTRWLWIIPNTPFPS